MDPKSSTFSESDFKLNGTSYKSPTSLKNYLHCAIPCLLLFKEFSINLQLAVREILKI